MLRPLPFKWDGTTMTPEQRFVALARRQFIKDCVYVLEGHEPASHADRGHYFASIKEAWNNLDAETTARYPTPEHLRKWALIKAGWRIENVVFGPDEAWAIRTVAFNKRQDDFAVTIVIAPSGGDELWSVRILVARSQKIGRPEDGMMTKDEWRQSKQDVLDILSQRLGVTRRELTKAGERA